MEIDDKSIIERSFAIGDLKEQPELCKSILERSFAIGDFVMASFDHPDYLFTGEITALSANSATATIHFLDGDQKENVAVDEITKITIAVFCKDLKAQAEATKSVSVEEYDTWRSEREKLGLHVDWERPPTSRILEVGQAVLAAYPIPSGRTSTDSRKRLKMYHAEIMEASECKMFYQVAFLDGKVVDNVHIDYIDKCSSDVSFQLALQEYYHDLLKRKGKFSADSWIAQRVERKLICILEASADGGVSPSRAV